MSMSLTLSALAVVVLENGTVVPPEDVIWHQWQMSRYGYERSISWYTGNTIEVELTADPRCYRSRPILDPFKYGLDAGEMGEWSCFMNADDEQY